MKIIIADNKKKLGKKAAKKGAELIQSAVAEKGYANVIFATGASQFEMLNELLKEKIDWTKVTAFHLDEYIGIPDSHPASFRKYLKERLVNKVPFKTFHYVNGDDDPEKECQRLGAIISKQTVDVAFIGIGENGHLAFNDPPADFVTTEPYIVVNLDEACRRQQWGEGWFSSINEVPAKAISMSIRQIMKSESIICCVPDLRKAEAVKKTLESMVIPMVPASMLQNHAHTWLYLDKDSSSMLS